MLHCASLKTWMLCSCKGNLCFHWPCLACPRVTEYRCICVRLFSGFCTDEQHFLKITFLKQLLPCQTAGVNVWTGCGKTLGEIFNIKATAVTTAKVLLLMEKIHSVPCIIENCHHGDQQKLIFRFQWRLSEQESMLLLSLCFVSCFLFSIWF